MSRLSQKRQYSDSYQWKKILKEVEGQQICRSFWFVESISPIENLYTERHERWLIISSPTTSSTILPQQAQIAPILFKQTNLTEIVFKYTSCIADQAQNNADQDCVESPFLGPNSEKRIRKWCQDFFPSIHQLPFTKMNILLGHVDDEPRRHGAT